MSQTTDNFFAALRQTTGGDVRTDLYQRTLYSTDASLYQVMPHGVFLPRHTEDLHAAVELAAKHHVPILPRGGGSSLAGQTVNEALVIDTSRHLSQILELNTEEQWAWVQPGLVLDQLNAQLKPHGLQFGPDPASSSRATLGGIVGNNSTGSHSIRYGMAVDHVLEAKVLLSDGTSAHFRPLNSAELDQHCQKFGLEGQVYQQISALVNDEANQTTIRTNTPKHWRRCGGYNLARFITDGSIDFFKPPVFSPTGKSSDNSRSPWERSGVRAFNLINLIVGSEGTLGTVSAVKLNLVKRPTLTVLAIVEFAELQAALEAVPLIIETNPAVAELLDNMTLSLAETVPAYARLMANFLTSSPFCLLAVEYTGETEAELRHQIDQLQRTIRQHGIKAKAVTPLFDSTQQASVWQVRKAGLGLLMSVRSDYKPIAFIEDTAVPVEHLASYIPRIEQFCADLGTKMAYYAHASAGCLHIRPLINVKLQSELDKIVEIQKFTLSLLHEYGGALSSEHGDGRVRSWLNEAFYGPELYGLYRQVKQIFDPHNLCNPGNIVDAPDVQHSLRFGPTYQTQSIDLHLDFSADGGFAGAIEMCNGAGVCRKVSSGGMCPSFMATREEEDSTRGRANMLRTALAGRIPHAELFSKRMYQVLGLCVSCKACKSECPSSVDLAKIKTEFLAHYYQHHRRPARDYLFSQFSTLAHWLSGPLAPLVNWSGQLPPVKWGMARALGLSGRRTLPQFAREPFPTWFRRWQSEQGDVGAMGQSSAQIILFPDPLNSYVYPQIAIAATKLLTAAGFRVVLPDTVLDSGRPALSKGMIAPARQTAHRVLTDLTPFAEAGTPIIFLEPSDQSAVQDDYAALLPNDSCVPLVAEASLSLSQFIAQHANDLPLRFSDQPFDLLLHGHCHQKALIGTEPTHIALTLAPNATLREIDTACCGMAGSFGYEAEHYDISLQMGERRLLPAVRQASPEALIVAEGVSCRQQIVHATGRRAYHPAEVLWMQCSK